MFPEDPILSRLLPVIAKSCKIAPQIDHTMEGKHQTSEEEHSQMDRESQILTVARHSRLDKDVNASFLAVHRWDDQRSAYFV